MQGDRDLGALRCSPARAVMPDGRSEPATLAASPAPRSIWHEVLRSDPEAMLTQTPEWLEALCDDGRYADASRLYETRSGRRLVMPLVRSARAPRLLATHSSLPVGCGFGGLVADGGVRTDDVAGVLTDLLSFRAMQLRIRPNPLAAPRWAAARPGGVVAVPRHAHVLDLAGGADAVWSQRFSAVARRNVRKAERLGVEIERDTTGKLIPAFYELFELSVVRWAARRKEPAWLARLRAHRTDPMRKLEALSRRLGDSFTVWLARNRGEPAAAIIVLYGTNAGYTRGAMNVELAGGCGANELLHWHAIQEACRTGARHYHMGESGSASLSRFKEKLGALPIDYEEYRIERLPITRLDALLRRSARSVLRRRGG